MTKKISPQVLDCWASAAPALSAEGASILPSDEIGQMARDVRAESLEKPTKDSVWIVLIAQGIEEDMKSPVCDEALMAENRLADMSLRIALGCMKEIATTIDPKARERHLAKMEAAMLMVLDCKNNANFPFTLASTSKAMALVDDLKKEESVLPPQRSTHPDLATIGEENPPAQILIGDTYYKTGAILLYTPASREMTGLGCDPVPVVLLKQANDYKQGNPVAVRSVTGAAERTMVVYVTHPQNLTPVPRDKRAAIALLPPTAIYQ